MALIYLFVFFWDSVLLYCNSSCTNFCFSKNSRTQISVKKCDFLIQSVSKKKQQVSFELKGHLNTYPKMMLFQHRLSKIKAF